MGIYSSNPYNSTKYTNAKVYNDDDHIDLKFSKRRNQETVNLQFYLC